ncbi:MAG: tetratricopeptide repeat protein [Anaerolineales bacterium]|nr:tetratricopeptide repeat protein [Anaerolineales bacterium]
MIVETRVGFGAWLRRSRKALDLTQAELAGAAGCSAITLRKIEAEERRPSEQLARRLAECLGVSLAQLGAFLRFARGDPWAGPAGSAPPALAGGQAAPLAGRWPAPLTSLVGREADVAAVVRLLSSPGTRLLTLVGPPGVGKTRLSLQVAAGLVGSPLFGDGGGFVSLALLTDPGLVAPAMAQALGLRDAGHRPLLDQLKQALQARRALLVLDNFEQVTEAATALPDLLSACPGLKLLASSRERLGVYGEWIYEVRPLATPDPGHLPPLETLREYGAIALFVERAHAAQPAFTLTAGNAAQVAALCAHVDGLPLALELLAAQLSSLPLAELLARLSGPEAGQFALRSDGLRGLPDRHRRMLDAIGWSYDRLSPGEQRLLARLGVFAGGFDLAAAGAICGEPAEGGPALAGTVAASVAALCTRHLVDGQAGLGDNQRFDLLEAIRLYALERLAMQGEAERLRQRHLAYFARLAASAAPHLLGPDQALWLNRLEHDHANLRAALGYALAEAQPTLALQMAVDLWRFWHVHAHLAEGRAWLEQALAAAKASAPPALRASGLNAAAALAGSRHQFDVARSYFEESLALRRALGDQRGIQSSLNNLGLCARNQGDYAAAQDLLHESLALARALGDTSSEARCLNNLGLVALSLADHQGARGCIEAGLALHRQLGNSHAMASSLLGLGEALARLEAVAEAASAFRESLVLHRQSGDWIGLAASLDGLAWAAGRQGQVERAGRLMGAAERLRDRSDAPMLEFARHLHALAETVVGGRDDPATLDGALAAGRRLSLEEAVAQALAA